MSACALKARNLSKRFWKKKSWFAKKEVIEAVKKLELEIHQGESVAFLGPNGAGKSTAIKLLCGILKPTTGQSWVAGHLSGTIEANKKLGLVFGTRSNLWMFLSVRQGLKMIGEIYGLSSKESLSRIQRLSELFEMTQLLDFTPNTLSLGERMRSEIVASLLHKPSILLADEPTIGLDVVGKVRFRTLLKQWQEEEKGTLLLTSHDVNDVEALCGRAVLINKGVIGYDGSLLGLKGNLANTREIKLTLAKPILNGMHESGKLGIQMLEDNHLVKKYQMDTQTISPVLAINYFMEVYKDNILDISVEDINLESIITQWYTENE
ncbi:MAG: ATP-binding cassette domain-containing protein [Waddliaceae bacterium]